MVFFVSISEFQSKFHSPKILRETNLVDNSFVFSSISHFFSHAYQQPTSINQSEQRTIDVTEIHPRMGFI